MNHTEEMKLLTAVQKLQKNTERIAIALEKLVKLSEETPVVTMLDPGFPIDKPPMYDCYNCANKDACPERGDDPCEGCDGYSKWEAR